MIDTSERSPESDAQNASDELLTLNDVAEALEVTWGRAYQLVVVEKRIPSIRPGYQHLVTRADFERFALEERPRGKPKGSKAGETASAPAAEEAE